MTRRIVVIGGGQNAEHDVSLATATAVAEALRSRGFDVDELTIDRDGMWRRGADALGSQATSSLAAALRIIERADVVFPTVHGPSGEDGTLAALCALAHTPMVGSGLRAGALGMDKWATKLVAEAVGIHTAPGRLVAAADIAGIGFETDVVVKPASAGSSFGVALRRCRPHRLLPHRRRTRPQRGQHHAGNDGRVPGAENVRRSRTALRAAGLRLVEAAAVPGPTSPDLSV